MVFLVITKPKTSSTINPENNLNSNSYTMSISVDGNIIKGSITNQNGTTELDEKGILTYALASFNSPRDIFLVECANGYQIKKASSSSGNNIIYDSVLKSENMELINSQKNIINFTCEKN